MLDKANLEIRKTETGDESDEPFGSWCGRECGSSCRSSFSLRVRSCRLRRNPAPTAARNRARAIGSSFTRSRCAQQRWLRNCQTHAGKPHVGGVEDQLKRGVHSGSHRAACPESIELSVGLAKKFAAPGVCCAFGLSAVPARKTADRRAPRLTVLQQACRSIYVNERTKNVEPHLAVGTRFRALHMTSVTATGPSRRPAGRQHRILPRVRSLSQRRWEILSRFQSYS
jgi:hypothetical protein